MELEVRAGDAASASRVFPWPVLEAGNGSYPAGIYSIRLEHKEPGRSFWLTHGIAGAPLIEEWIEAKKVRFVCAVSAPVSAYRKLHVSRTEKQVVEWDAMDLGSHPLFTPMIVSDTDIEHKVRRHRDGLDGLWSGATVGLPRGARVAVFATFALQSGVLGLLDFCCEERFGPGQLRVDPSSLEGFRFKVRLSEDLFGYLRLFRQEEAGQNIMTHIVSAALMHLKAKYGGDDGEEGWESYANLVALADLLEDKQLGHWSDRDFDPEFVATSLYPHRVPSADQG